MPKVKLQSKPSQVEKPLKKWIHPIGEEQLKSLIRVTCKTNTTHSQWWQRLGYTHSWEFRTLVHISSDAAANPSQPSSASIFKGFTADGPRLVDLNFKIFKYQHPKKSHVMKIQATSYPTCILGGHQTLLLTTKYSLSLFLSADKSIWVSIPTWSNFGWFGVSPQFRIAPYPGDPGNPEKRSAFGSRLPVSSAQRVWSKVLCGRLDTLLPAIEEDQALLWPTTNGDFGR